MTNELDGDLGQLGSVPASPAAEEESKKHSANALLDAVAESLLCLVVTPRAYIQALL